MGTASPRVGRRRKSGKGKAIALAVLVGVGLCFWVPMLLKSKDDGRGGKAAKASDEKAKASTPGEGKSAKPSGTAELPTEWKKLQALLVANSTLGTPTPAPQAKTKSKASPVRAPQILPVRDPFAGAPGTSPRRAPRGADVIAGGKGRQTFDLTAESPQDVGLRLCSTVVGKSFRGAIISGDVYQVGDLAPRVPASQVPEGTELFTVTDIQMREVMLRRQGRKYVLPMKPSLSPGRGASVGAPRGRRSRRGGKEGG